MRRPGRRPLALSAALITATAGCAGCSLVSHPKPASCTWAAPGAAASPASTADATSSTVVLIDTSASDWPKQGSSARLPDNAQQAAAELVRNYAQAGTRLVSLGTFNGSSTTIDWRLADVALPRATGTQATIQNQQKAAAGCLSQVASEAEQQKPVTGGTDVLGALDAAGTQLGSAPAARSEVMLFTDGLSNTGCLNFNQVVSAGERASDVVRSCPGQGGLARLRGVSLKLAGIGLQAQAKPLTTSEQSWLVGYWRDVCAALGVAAAQACVASPGADTRPRTSAVDRPADPAVSFAPRVKEGPVPIPADLLFAFNSSALTQMAQSYLDILIPRIRASGLAVTRIVGHTDRIGTAAYNLGLSLRRAQAVQAYLAEHGFRGIGVQGVGFSQPACKDESATSGQPNSKCMAKDRRVVIFLGGHS